MLPSRGELRRWALPPVIAVALTLIFFFVFDRWEKFDDPINSIVVPVFGVIGFAVQVGLDRFEMKRRRANMTSSTS